MCRKCYKSEKELGCHLDVHTLIITKNTIAKIILFHYAEFAIQKPTGEGIIGIYFIQKK